MTQDKLNKIIDRENENLEEQAVRKATDIISNISRLRANIANSEAQITELQAELKKIEILKLDPIQILGA